MYAKLVVPAGGPNLVPFKVIRDIGRLITATTANTSLLEAFSTSASAIVDTTSAGWTYVGSNYASDQAAIPAVGAGTTPTANTYYNLCFSAPINNYPNLLKYCALTVTYAGITATGNTGGFTLTGAQSFSSSGVATNEGIRWGSSYTVAPVIDNAGSGEYFFKAAAGSTFHVIANPRHLTIIKELQGIMAVWESSMTDVDIYYNQAPFIQVWHPTTSNRLERMTNGYGGLMNSAIKTPKVVNTNTTLTGGTDVQGQAHIGFNITDPNTVTTYGTFDLNDWAVGPFLTGVNATQGSTGNFYGGGLYYGFPSGMPDVLRMRRNTRSLAITSNTHFASTISSTGAKKYAVAPIYYCNDQIGYPTQFISGVTPVYYTNSGIGNTGDTVSINGTSYTYFDTGFAYGILALTY